MRHADVAGQVVRIQFLGRSENPLRGPSRNIEDAFGFQRESYLYSLICTPMPELPDITVYIEALEQRISGHTLTQAQIASPFLLRTIEPPVAACVGHKVSSIRRVGKRIAIGFDNDVWLVLHLMIAGRLHWFEKAKKPDGRRTLAAFLFDNGCLTLTEAGSQKRASLHMAAGEAGLAALDPGGMDVMTASARTIRARTDRREPHAEARSHRSARVQRNRQRVFGRDPASRAAFAHHADIAIDG